MTVAILTKEKYEDIVCRYISKEFTEKDLESPVKGALMASLFIFADEIANEIFGGDN